MLILEITDFLASSFGSHRPNSGLTWLRICCSQHYHTGQCKRTGGCYNELVVAFHSTGGGVKGKKIYTC